MVFPRQLTQPSRQALDLFLSMLKNYGELTFRVGSKCTLIGLAYLLDDRTFGQLSLFLVVEAIVNNISRFGVDRLILKTGEGVIQLPWRRHLVSLALMFGVMGLTVAITQQDLWLVLAILSGIVAGQYYLAIVGYRLSNVRKYNRLRATEIGVRVLILVFASMQGIDAFSACMALAYAVLLGTQLKRPSWAPVSQDSLIAYNKFSLFALYSFIRFLLTGADRIIIEHSLGTSIQGMYSKYLSVVGVMSFAYLFIGFLYEPKIYVDKGNSSLIKYLSFSSIGNASLFLVMFACKDLLFTSPDLTLLGLIGVLFLIYPFEFAFIYHLTKKSRVRVITAQQVVQLVMVFSAAWLLGVDRVHDVVIFILAAKAISLAGGLFYNHVATV